MRLVFGWETVGNGWSTRDRIRLPIVGGRAEGFRAYAVKTSFEPGLWRVIAETEDGRAMASLTFTVKEDGTATERVWRTVGG